MARALGVLRPFLISQMIDANLVTAASPHLDIDFTDIMNSMSVFESDDGDLFLMTSIVVPSPAAAAVNLMPA